MLKLYLAVITLGLIAHINCESVPAFIFGDKTPTFLPTLQHISGDEFVTLVKSQADKDTLTVVFVENKLSVEDLSHCKLNTRTCFENLRKTDKTYLSSVEHPVDSLIGAFGERKSITVGNNDDLNEASLNGEKILFVYLDDVESPEDFYKHDELISKLLQQLKSKYGDVIAIYTGIHPSFKYSEPLKRKVREAEMKNENADEKPVNEKPVEEPKSTAAPPKQVPKQQVDSIIDDRKVYLDSRYVLLAFAHMNITERKLDANTTSIPFDSTTITVSETNATAMLIEIAAPNHSLKLYTTISAGTWNVDFTYNGEKYHPRTAVRGFGESFSFGCGDLYIESFTHTIQLGGFQMQPTFEPATDAPLSRPFTGRVNDCVGYFTPGIWGALFVIIIMVLILTYGLSMMMDIRTMDKFDDPKGKTIIVNAQE